MRATVSGILGAMAMLCVGTAQASDLCPVPGGGEALGHGLLTRTQAELATGGPITVIAIGSSSTQGAGASSPAAAYPAQLEAMLDQRYGASRITVVNKGIGGETASANLARFDADVVTLHPDLVIWQVGTNDGLQKVPVDDFVANLRDGASRIRAVGSDLILMNPQYFPGETKVANAAGYVQAVLAVGRELGIPVLDRHAIMKWWLDSGRFAADAVLSPDGLHLKDASYHCLAEFLAEMITMPRTGPKTAAR